MFVIIAMLVMFMQNEGAVIVTEFRGVDFGVSEFGIEPYILRRNKIAKQCLENWCCGSE